MEASIIGKSLKLLCQGLYPYVEEKMRLVYGNQWLSQAKQCMNRDTTLKRGFEESLRQDASVLLIVMTKRWEKVFKSQLSYTERALASEIIDIRNQWAHNHPFSPEDTYRALDSITRLLEAVEAVEAQEVEQYRQNALRSLADSQNRQQRQQKGEHSQDYQIRERLNPLLANIPFQDATLLQQALTRSSYAQENRIAEDNEALEFLGDSVLGFLAGDYLYQTHNTRSEERLSRLREKLVNNAQLSQFARELHLDQFMLLSRGDQKQEQQNKASVLSDTFEAVIGAYYLDSGVEAVRGFIYPLLESVADQLISDNLTDSSLVDPKGRLQQYAQKKGLPIPEYQHLREHPPFICKVKINGQFYGRSSEMSRKKEAEKAAATDAITRLDLS